MPHRDLPQAHGHRARPLTSGGRSARRLLAHQAATLAIAAILGQAWATAAQAQTPNVPPLQPPQPTADCPATFAQAATPEAQRSQLKLAQSLAADCDSRADYHAHLGQLLLQGGQHQAAANALEKSLLLNPEQPGTQLDYAHALALLGEKASAQHIVSQVSARPDIDPGLRQWLLGGNNPQPSPTPRWTWAQLLQTTAGHESNLTSATHANAITLYLSNGPVLVPLDDGAQPQSGTALKTLLAAQGQSPPGSPDLRLSLALQTRNAKPAADNHLLALSGSYVRPLGAGQAHLRWDGQQYKSNNSFAYTSQGLSLQYHWVPRSVPCKWHVTLGSADQSYAGSPDQDGRFHQARFDGSCKHPDQSETHWGLGAGQDRAQSSQRPGGNKNRSDWGVRHDRTLGNTATQLWLKQTRQQDRERFSPLLGELVSRSIRTDWGAGAWWPLSGQWSWGLEVESTSQKSTNALLNIRNLSIYTGLRWTSP